MNDNIRCRRVVFAQGNKALKTANQFGHWRIAETFREIFSKGKMILLQAAAFFNYGYERRRRKN